jgi:ketosteroid isomerase-like protein
MHPNAALVTRFYEAFQRRDAEAMAACYTPDARFSDPVFQDLNGSEVGDMWRMLALGARDFSLTFRDVKANDFTGSAHWEADYTFSKTGRKVHNVIEARFVFRDGKIERHADEFDLKAWLGMALGPMGKVFGGSRRMHAKVRKDAARRLAAYRSGR